MDKKEAYDPARDDVGRLINKISHQLKRQMCFHQEESELTNMQKRVLHYILFQSLKKDIYQKDIEKEFQIRRSTATGILQLLEKNGFLIRETVEWDARGPRGDPFQHTLYGNESEAGNLAGGYEGLHESSGTDVYELVR